MENTLNTHFSGTARMLMQERVPRILPSHTIKEARNMILKEIDSFESINYIYVVDRSGKLAGVLSIKELFRQSESKRISDVMIRDVITIRSSTDQERVAYLALKNSIKAVPVVNKDNDFLGVVLSDSILQTLYDEIEDDLLHLTGVHKKGSSLDDIMTMSSFSLFKHRMPWLFLGILGGILASKVIGFFDSTLEENIILAAFIPLVVYIASAVSMQMGVFLIRDTAMNPRFDFTTYFFKQLKVVFLIAVTTSLLLSAYSFFAHGDLAIVSVLGVAIFATILSSIFTGLFIPYIMSELKSDPANASGPIATIVQDIMSLSIYFIIASLLL